MGLPSYRGVAVWSALRRDRERRDIGGASGSPYFGTRSDLRFKGLISAGTPNVWFFRTHMRKPRSRAESQSSVPLFDWHDRPFAA